MVYVILYYTVVHLITVEDLQLYRNVCMYGYIPGDTHEFYVKDFGCIIDLSCNSTTLVTIKDLNKIKNVEIYSHV